MSGDLYCPVQILRETMKHKSSTGPTTPTVCLHRLDRVTRSPRTPTGLVRSRSHPPDLQFKINDSEVREEKEWDGK